MSTYKPGYIEGKKKLGVYVDEELHKDLRIRAAETDESMGDIVERALRREFGVAPVLSRKDSVIITSGEWVLDQDDGEVVWWTVTTNKTGDHRFRTFGLNKDDKLRVDDRFVVGSQITLHELASVPVPVGILAYSESDAGPVLAGIGRVRDKLEPLCGPIAYLVPRARTRNDTVDPSNEQMIALRIALDTLMSKGVDAAIEQLQTSGLFTNVFADPSGCPLAPSRLTGGAFEWRSV